MKNHPIRKFLGLTVLYSIIILGIFALQFRNVSSINKSFGLLQLRLSETTDTETTTLENVFSASFKGFILYGDNETPVTALDKDNKKIALTLLDVKDLTENAVTLYFSENISLTLSNATTIEGTGPQLFITGQIPITFQGVNVPYKASGAYSLRDFKNNKVIFQSKSESFLLQANDLTENSIFLSSKETSARYVTYVESSLFDFETITSYPCAQQTAYNTTVSQLTNSFLSSYIATKEDPVSEQAIIAYVSEFASSGKYRQATNNIPDSFLTGTKRTYLTTNYFNSLVKMNQTLVMQNENIRFKVSQAIPKNDIDIFGIDNFDSYLIHQPESEIRSVFSILQNMITKDDLQLTTEEITGILETYNNFKENRESLVADFQPILDYCINAIKQICTPTDTELTLNNGTISILNTVKLGKALLNYGKLGKDNSLTAGGYALINTALKSPSQIDTRTLSELYITLKQDNTYIPHVALLDIVPEKTTWAWTCAEKITYETDAKGNVTIKTTFPQGESHYMILNGIEPFEGIEIYGVAFRTDPRFEAYNSSGYAYDAKTKTLFLKFRHRAATETVRLIYEEEPVVVTPVTTEETPTTTEVIN